MKRLFLALAFLVMAVFPISATVFHIWTAIIAFTEGGFFSGLLTLCLPVLGEIYWMFAMWGENDAYTALCIFHLVGALLVTLAKGSR